jgi:hypothetical protein
MSRMKVKNPDPLTGDSDGTKPSKDAPGWHYGSPSRDAVAG